MSLYYCWSDLYFLAVARLSSWSFVFVSSMNRFLVRNPSFLLNESSLSICLSFTYVFQSFFDLSNELTFDFFSMASITLSRP
jgi:hypothetical protein